MYSSPLSTAAETIVEKVAEQDKEIVRRTIARAIEQVPQHISIRLRVNPRDVEIARELCSNLRPWRTIEIYGDETIASGGCIVEMDFGEIDATLQSQLRRLREAILQE